MGYTFADTNRITFGSDASIDNFATHTIAFWFMLNTLPAAGNDLIVFKSNGATLGWMVGVSTAGVLGYFDFWSGGGGVWSGPTLSTGVLYHIVVTYDGGDVANDPLMYLDGVSQTVTEVTAPVTARTTDAASTLQICAAGAGVGALCRVQNLEYVSGIWDAAQVNRHKWWGRVGGAVAVRHPLITAKVTNEGTATANGTVTGATAISLPKTERWAA